jgi:hypothetical protein
VVEGGSNFQNDIGERRDGRRHDKGCKLALH